MPGRFTGRTAWLPSHPAGTGSHGGLCRASLGDPGVAPASPYADADGLVQPKSGSYPVAGRPFGGLNGPSAGATLSLT